MSASGSQSGAGSSGGYFDPEAPDLSEQEFSASLENISESPHFVVDAAEVPPEAGNASVLVKGPGAVADSPVSPNGDSAEDLSKAGQLREADPSPAANSDWREQVSAKVSKYKSRSQHKVRYPSLQLPFELPSYSSKPEQAKVPHWLSEPETPDFANSQFSPAAQPEPPRISLETTARVLEFPRFVAVAVDPDALADPVLHRPRIVEAPELLPPPPAMGGITIETASLPEPERRPGFDMPLQSAPLSQRVWAGAIDALLIAIAVATFAYFVVRISGAVLPWQTLWKSGAALFALLWPVYEYAFLVFSEATPGIRLARLELQRFDGTPAPRNLRRWRVLASLLSAVSLGLGYAWCFLDEDQLSWHDRITRTHLAPQRTR